MPINIKRLSMKPRKPSVVIQEKTSSGLPYTRRIMDASIGSCPSCQFPQPHLIVGESFDQSFVACMCGVRGPVFPAKDHANAVKAWMSLPRSQP